MLRTSRPLTLFRHLLQSVCCWLLRSCAQPLVAHRQSRALTCERRSPRRLLLTPLAIDSFFHIASRAFLRLFLRDVETELPARSMRSLHLSILLICGSAMVAVTCPPKDDPRKK